MEEGTQRTCGEQKVKGLGFKVYFLNYRLGLEYAKL